MIKYLLVLFVFTTFQALAQTDKNGNPIFNSVMTNEETIDDFQLHSNYYTLKNNIENKNSSVYISEKPTLNDIENFSQNLPSDFFIITKDGTMLNMIMILNKPTRQFLVINPTTGEQEQFPCSLKGDIFENRANEIINEKYDSKAKIKRNKLYFNSKKYTIISNKEIKESITTLIMEKQLGKIDSANIKLLSKDDLKAIVLAESKEGGKFDFFTEIKGHEYDGVQVKPGVFSTKLGIALYKWGRANFELGTNTLQDTLEFWEEFKNREANQKEKEYIKMGFNKELEK